VIVKESQDLSHTELLEKYFEKPVKSTVLVFCHKNGSVDKRKKILSLAMANGVVFESNKKKDYELSPFIENYLKERGVAIEKKATMMMVENIGSDLHRLISELDKLQITLPANDKRITPDIVEKQIGVSKDFNGFELRNAIISKDVYKANEIMKYFDSNPKAGSPYMLLPLIFNFFENLMLAYYCPNPRNERELAAFLGLKSLWGVRDYITGMRNFTGRKTMQIIDKIRETDAKIKGLDSKNTPSGDIMKELIFFILH
jgi:DNA polymerase-3 subunit delta